MANEIPVVDMEDFPAELPKLREACEQWGCFRVINHNIPLSLLLDMKLVVRSLLDLPAEIKRRNTDRIPGSGYVPPTSKNPLYEALGLYDATSSEDVADFCSLLEASAEQSETIKKYSVEVVNLAKNLGRKIAQSVGVDSDLFNEWPCQFRINKYTLTEEAIGSLGVQMHTDSGFLTILQEDDCVGGLEVMDKTGEFIAVSPFPSSLLVNLGDVAKAWSNGRFCNVKHQVRCKEVAIRVSIAMFVVGPKEEAVEAPLEIVGSDALPLYRPFTVEEYRKCRLSTGLQAGEALSLYSTQQA